MQSRRYFLSRVAVFFTTLAGVCLFRPRLATTAHAAPAPTMFGGNAVITLPAPDKDGGKPLMQALAQRKSIREFSDAPLELQDVSNLLWAAFGVNRPDGRRTAPTARNRQNVLVFAVLNDGIWRYEALRHELVKVHDSSLQLRLGAAPLTLLFAAQEDEYGGMQVGSLYQNTGLYCASAGLANVVKATGMEEAQKEVSLPPGYKILIIQNVGHAQ